VIVLGQDVRVTEKPVARARSTVTTYLDHTGILDDRDVQKLIQKRYEQAGSTLP
jgi:hypothetical protein